MEAVSTRTHKEREYGNMAALGGSARRGVRRFGGITRVARGTSKLSSPLRESACKKNNGMSIMLLTAARVQRRTSHKRMRRINRHFNCNS